MTRLTMQSDLVEQLGSAIAAGRYRPGDTLRTEEIEREFDLSRTVVREAIKVLESMRLIDIRRSVGITVLDHTQWNVFDPRLIEWRLAGPDHQRQLASLTDLRVAVEPVAAARFASIAGDEQRQALRAITDGMVAAAKAHDIDSFINLDVTFHTTLLEGSGNDMFAALGQVITPMLCAHPERSDPDHDRKRFDTLAPHLLLAEHIANRDGAAAEQATRDVLARAREEMELPAADTSPSTKPVQRQRRDGLSATARARRTAASPHPRQETR